jgi:hypothetical protein
MPIRLVAGETSDEQDAAAIRWAAENGAWIINNSWGPPDGNPLFLGDEIVYPLPDIVRSAIDYAADEGRGGKGCIICWAAGNGNEPLSYDGYASYHKAIAVGACTDQGLKAYYSDYGPELDVCAPSNGGKSPGMWTTDIMGAEGYNAGGQHGWGDTAGNYVNDFGGTSGATPVVSGVAALLLAVQGELTREEVTQQLIDTADRIGLENGRYDLNGHSNLYGKGRVNAYAALTGRTRHPQLSISVDMEDLRAGDPLNINYNLIAGTEPIANHGTPYVVIMPPQSQPRFIGRNLILTLKKIPLATAILVTDTIGTLRGDTLLGMPQGTYQVYAAIVAEGYEPYDSRGWIHNPARTTFTFGE